MEALSLEASISFQQKPILNQLLHQYYKIMHKGNISWYWCKNCFIVWLKVFVALHNNFVARPLVYVARQSLFVTKSVASYCDVYSYVQRLKWTYFQFYRFLWNRAIFVSVQYRKIMHTRITLNYCLTRVPIRTLRLICCKCAPTKTSCSPSMHAYIKSRKFQILLL